MAQSGPDGRGSTGMTGQADLGLEALPDFGPLDIAYEAGVDAEMHKLEDLRAAAHARSSGRSDTELLNSLCHLMEETLMVQRHILNALGSSSDSRSSIEVKTSTRGVDISSKHYADSSMDGLSDRAVDEYFATLDRVQARINGASK